MLSRRALSAVLAAAALEAYAPRELHALPSRELFTLARSMNANIVKYAVRPARNGGFDLAAPVEAYWLMVAEDGRREELSWTERQLAYGFSVSNLSRASLILHLTACSQRPLRVTAAPSGFYAETEIAGQAARLRRIFVRTDEGLLMPRVRYVEIFGLTAAGRSVVERIIPR